MVDKLLELHRTWVTAGILYKDAIMRVSQFIVAHACEFASKDADVDVYFYFIRELHRAVGMSVPVFPDLHFEDDDYYYNPYQGHDYSQRERDEWEEERREEERDEWEEWESGGGQGCGECIDVCRCGGN